MPGRIRRTRLERPAAESLLAGVSDAIDELIKENRRLLHQVDALSTKGSAFTSGAVERALRRIQGRLQRSVQATKPVRAAHRSRTTVTKTGPSAGARRAAPRRRAPVGTATVIEPETRPVAMESVAGEAPAS